MFGERQKHESYGMISITHVSGGKQPLFCSSLKHERFVCLRIKKGEVERDLHREWYGGREPLIEVWLSPAQFAEFITTPNTGEGVPCTVRQVKGQRMEDPPYIGQNEVFHDEMVQDFNNALSKVSALEEEARAMLSSKGPMKVADKKRLLGKLENLSQHIRSNIPFLHKQFARAMGKTVIAAKAEVEAFYTSAIHRLGRKALEEGVKPDLPQIEQGED